MKESRIITDVNRTSYNKLFKNTTDKIKSSLNTYVNENLDLNLSYEFKVDGGTKLVFITGFSRDELEIPIFDNPIIIKDIKNRDVVCTDLRKYIKKVTEQPLYLKEIYKDIGSFNFIINRTLLVAEFCNKNFSAVKQVDKNLCSAFCLLFSNLINYVINLNPIEKVNVEIALAYYFYTMTIEEDDIETSVNNVIAKISKTDLSMPLSLKDIEPVVNKLIKVINMESNEDFINNLKSVLEDDKKPFINMTVLTNTMNNMWFGPTGDSALLIGLQNYPTLATLINSAVSDKTFARSRLSTFLGKYTRKIKPDEIEKTFELFQKERTI